MSPEERVNQAILAFNQRDVAGYTAQFSEEAVLHDPFYPEPIEGREALAAVIGGIWGSFSDVHWELGGPVVANGKGAAFPVAIRMTHDGPMPLPDGSVIEPTGEKISFTSGVFWTLDDDGLVADERGYFDATAIAMQLGLVG